MIDIKVTTIHGRRQFELSVLTPTITKMHSTAYTVNDTITVIDVKSDNALIRMFRRQVNNSSPAMIMVPVFISKQQQSFNLQKYIAFFRIPEE